MDQDIKAKAVYLVEQTRVMTIAVSQDDIPWSSPVYFVFHDQKFYFFSNEQSKHVLYGADKKKVSASIYHDSDKIDEIFGFQMSGTIEKGLGGIEYLKIVKKYVHKFNFLEKIFGPQIFENKLFFKEKFKSHLFVFHPEFVCLSDNSNTSGKRREIDLKKIDA